MKKRAVFSRMNNFFCSLHLLVNFADVCGESLEKFENLYLKDTESAYKRSECGTIRLSRTARKAFGRGVDEKSCVFR